MKWNKVKFKLKNLNNEYEDLRTFISIVYLAFDHMLSLLNRSGNFSAGKNHLQLFILIIVIKVKLYE